MKSFKQLTEIIEVPMKRATSLPDLDQHYKDIQSAAEKIHDKPKLTSDEFDHVYNYSKYNFRGINRHLRDHEHDFNTYSEIPHIDSAIAKHKVKDDIHVYRRFSHEQPHMLDTAEIGDTVHDKGFVSTTLDGGHTGFIHTAHPKDDSLIKIHIPKGSHAMYLNKHRASHFPDEHEVLLPRGSKFKYTGKSTFINHLGQDVTIHHLTHIPEGTE
jgi:hypothetical protein